MSHRAAAAGKHATGRRASRKRAAVLNMISAAPTKIDEIGEAGGLESLPPKELIRLSRAARPTHAGVLDELRELGYPPPLAGVVAGYYFGEVWAQADGFPDVAVSSYGGVTLMLRRQWPEQRREYNANARKNISMYRGTTFACLVLRMFGPEAPDDACLAYVDGDEGNIHPSNLLWERHSSDLCEENNCPGSQFWKGCREASDYVSEKRKKAIRMHRYLRVLKASEDSELPRLPGNFKKLWCPQCDRVVRIWETDHIKTKEHGDALENKMVALGIA
jgi:hypothetical protein